MTEFLEEVVLDTLIDFAKLLPFLFLTYLFMEFLEHKAGEKMENAITKAGRFGPVLGGLLGLVPQCGFSAAAAGLFAGRVITVGTLLSVFLATSDEMLPVMLASRAPALLIVKILAGKFLVAVIAGFAVDLLYRVIKKDRTVKHGDFHEMCECEHCHCEKGIFRSALHHTLHISLFLLLVMLALNAGVFFIGEERLSGVFSGIPVVGQLLAALVGLIPNCAASVLITQLYLDGVISVGCLFSGLLVGAGVGVILLLRANKKHWKENLCIVVLLYAVGVAVGVLLDLIGAGAWF